MRGAISLRSALRLCLGSALLSSSIHPRPPIAIRRHRRNSARAGAAQQLQEQRLGLVVGMVCDSHDIRIGSSEDPVASASSYRFEALSAFAFEIEPVFGKCDAATRALLGAKARPCIGVA